MTLAPQQPICAPAADQADPLAVAMDDFLGCDKPLSEFDRELYAMLDTGEFFPELPVPGAKGGQPFAHPAPGADDGAEAMVGWDALHPEAPVVPPQSGPPCRASPSPSSSETSYKPASASDSGSDFTESRKMDVSPRSKDSKAHKVDPRIGRRKPEVDLTSISDVTERRKQRRLAKNRATAATSRARKRALMATLQQQVDQLVQENKVLKAQLAACDCVTRGGAAPALVGGSAARTRS